MPDTEGGITALLGGVLIGGAASGLLLVNGRIAGISNIVGRIDGARLVETGESNCSLVFHPPAPGF